MLFFCLTKPKLWPNSHFFTILFFSHFFLCKILLWSNGWASFGAPWSTHASCFWWMVKNIVTLVYWYINILIDVFTDVLYVHTYDGCGGKILMIFNIWSNFLLRCCLNYGMLLLLNYTINAFIFLTIIMLIYQHQALLTTGVFFPLLPNLLWKPVWWSISCWSVSLAGICLVLELWLFGKKNCWLQLSVSN